MDFLLEYHKYDYDKDFLSFINKCLNINISASDFIGNGYYSMVYSIDGDRVIKISPIGVNEPYEVDNFAKIYKYDKLEVPNKYLDESPNRYTTITLRKKGYGKFYLAVNKEIPYIEIFIMEKVYYTQEVTELLEDMCEDIKKIFYNNFKKFKEISMSTYELGGIIDSNNSILMQFIQKNCNNTKLNDFIMAEIDKKELFTQLLNIFQTLKKEEKIWNDSHTKQFGVNNNGDLVAFDL